MKTATDVSGLSMVLVGGVHLQMAQIRYTIGMQELKRKTSRLPGRWSGSVKFSWDVKKAIANLKKHGVSFEEASTVFRDVLAATGSDPDHSLDERRFVTFGFSRRHRLLVVAHCDEGDGIRIISARLATKPERKIYEEE